MNAKDRVSEIIYAGVLDYACDHGWKAVWLRALVAALQPEARANLRARLERDRDKYGWEGCESFAGELWRALSDDVARQYTG